jgi:hypothetical protein
VIALKGGRQSATKSEVLRVLRTVRDGGRPHDTPAGYQAVAEAITAGWLEVLNDRARVERWKYRLTREGAKRAGPVLRLLQGGTTASARPC